MRIIISLTFRSGTYGETEEFASQVVLRTDQVERYAALQAQVDIIKPLLAIFVNAVAVAADGGKTLTQAKKIAKENLINALEDLALMTKLNANGDETYVTGAGFSLKKKAVRNATRPLEKPEWNYLRRGVLSGTVEGEVKNFPPGTREIGVKYSYDNWTTERNGTYSTGKKFVLKGLDVKRDVEVKLCFQGTFQRKSDESASMGVFVL